jgi:hypothetical protein
LITACSRTICATCLPAFIKTHAGTLKKEDAQDLLDFATALLERIITEPARLRLAKERREKRREPKVE